MKKGQAIWDEANGIPIDEVRAEYPLMLQVYFLMMASTIILSHLKLEWALTANYNKEIILDKIRANKAI